MAESTHADDRQWKALRAKLKKMHAEDAHVRVGVLASRGGSEIHDDASGLSLIEIAAIHEFGSPAAGIPERSFIRATAKANQAELASLQMKLARGILNDTITVERALGILGAWLQAKIKSAITDGAGIPPPLAAATIAAKGSSRPLVDTGRLVQSIQWEVVMRGGAG